MVFVFSLIVFLIAGLFCLNVAEEKGYNGFLWFIGGFFFSFIALIAVAGLPDKKLRKYIRQIGESQNAIDPEGSSNLEKVIDDKPLTPEERKELIKKVGKRPSWDNISKLDKWKAYYFWISLKEI